MLTRIEIDGFKSFKNLNLDLKPFTVIAGANASGKSNFFDALRFLSMLSTSDVSDALRGIRGEPSELFFREPDGTTSKSIRLAAEVLLDGQVEDAFGEQRNLKYTRLRYEVEIEQRSDERSGPKRVFVAREEARIIKRSEDSWLKSEPKPSSLFIETYAHYASGGVRSPFIETKPDRFYANQDGVQGRPRPFPLSRERASATVLSRITTAIEFPHLYALKQELSSITFLQLEAAAERGLSDALGPDELLPDGSNVARVLARIEAETRSEDLPRGIIPEIRNQLALLIPGVKEIRVERDPSGRYYQLLIKMVNDAEFSSRVVSDGTLRVLALLTFLNDPKRKNVLLFEEPENGIHEQRLVELARLLRKSATDQSTNKHFRPDRLFQVIINTHSPVLLHETKQEELVIVDMISNIDPATKRSTRRSRMRTGVLDQSEFRFGDRERRLTRDEANRIIKRGDESSI